MTRRLNIFITLTTAALTCTSARLLQAQAEKTPENFQGAGTGNAPDFQKYVFFAYGLPCLLLFLFTFRTIGQCRNLQKRVDYLEERFKKANPGGDPQADEAGGTET